MKILVVTQYFWPENFKINDLVAELVLHGNEVTVLTGIPNYPEGKFYKGYSILGIRKQNNFGARIIRVPIWPRKNGNTLNLFLNYISYAITASFYSLFLKKVEFDKIFVFEISPVTVGIPAIVAKIKTQAPIFFWVLDLWPESVFSASNVKSSTLYNILNKLVKFIYKKSDLILVSSKSFTESITKKGISKQKIKYFPNWAEDVFTTNNIKIGLESPKLPDGFIILYAGNIGVAQDFDSVIKAMEICKKQPFIKWIIIGDGRQKKYIQKLITEKKLENNVFLLGRYPINYMPYFYSKADALFLSLKNEPIFRLTVPAKLQTYLAANKPIIAMLSGEGNDIIKESKGGFACEAGNFEQLARNAIKISKLSKKELNKMALSGFNYYKKYFEKNKLIEFINDELNSKKYN
ncbi:MAG: glycosyltransferase family 4 protein [Bacteroidales bacterium]|nr:glycosyltransferase family 4 protein [Bacteroidales bacterium]